MYRPASGAALGPVNERVERTEIEMDRGHRQEMRRRDRNAQFDHINKTAEACLDRGSPVISVDTKKKELVGNFKNGGREWQPAGEPDLSTCTTSRRTLSARRSRTASTTSPPTMASSAWE